MRRKEGEGSRVFTRIVQAGGLTTCSPGSKMDRSPDLIRCLYRFQYNALPSPRSILKAIRAGVGFGSGTETNAIREIIVRH